MIRYALECACGERFEAWFRNASGCDSQLSAGAVNCPACAGTDVSKALMAPAVPKKDLSPASERERLSTQDSERAEVGGPGASPAHGRGASERTAADAAPKTAGADADMNAGRGEHRAMAAFAAAQIEEKLRALRAHIEKTAEPVGKNFAKEARAIHEGDAEERAIYGEATREEAQELLEDGVPVAPIPWIDKRDN